jgi:hemoglobin
MNRTRKSPLFAAIAALALSAAPGAFADVTFGGIAADAPTRFGPKAAVDNWAQDLNYYVQGDNRINRIFGFNGDATRQKALQDDLEALVLSSPADPAVARSIVDKYQLALTVTEYNAMIENAYLACDATRTRYSVCNRIVAALAPFEHAAVSR